MNQQFLKIFAVGFLLLMGSSASYAYEEITYFHSDALGSPVLATDEQGQVKWRESYSPYGSRLTRASQEVDPGTGEPIESSWDEKQWFTGKIEESRVGLQYFGARWYEPEIGRFISPDPVQFKEGNAFSFNRYAYANNNPYRYIDPDGRESYLVSRPLGGDSKVASHNFVVSHAKYLGDPNAKVYSWGENALGLTGRVDTGTKGFSEETHADDVSAWIKLAGDSKQAKENSTLINALDSKVEQNANKLIEDTDYAAVGASLGSGTNSNSAASAVANKSQGSEVKVPGGSRLSPGAGKAAKKINFRE
jgi:RHS repeat-associated protein